MLSSPAAKPPTLWKIVTPLAAIASFARDVPAASVRMTSTAAPAGTANLLSVSFGE